MAEAYQANTLPEGPRERKEDIHGRVEPFCQVFLAGSGLIELLDLLLKQGENGGGRVAGLKLGCERMCKEVLFRMIFVHFEGIIEE